MFGTPICPVNCLGLDVQLDNEIKLWQESKLPPQWKLYPVDVHELEELKGQVKNFLSNGRIVNFSSPYGVPIFFAKKKDGGIYM